MFTILRKARAFSRLVEQFGQAWRYTCAYRSAVISRTEWQQLLLDWATAIFDA